MAKRKPEQPAAGHVGPSAVSVRVRSVVGREARAQGITRAHPGGVITEVAVEPSAIVVTIRRKGQAPFAVTFTAHAIARAALDAERQYRGPAARPDESTPGGREGNDDARGAT